MRCHCLQVTHTVIVLSPTLVACHHFSTFLSYLSSFFPSSAQLVLLLLSFPPCPQCSSLPQRTKPEHYRESSFLGCFSGLAALTTRSPSGPVYILKDPEAACFLTVILLIRAHVWFPVFFFPSIIDTTIDNMLIFMDFTLALNSFFWINSQDWDPWANGSEFCIAFTLYCHIIFQKRLILLPAVY